MVAGTESGSSTAEMGGGGPDTLCRGELTEGNLDRARLEATGSFQPDPRRSPMRVGAAAREMRSGVQGTDAGPGRDLYFDPADSLRLVRWTQTPVGVFRAVDYAEYCEVAGVKIQFLERTQTYCGWMSIAR